MNVNGESPQESRATPVVIGAVVGIEDPAAARFSLLFTSDGELAIMSRGTLTIVDFVDIYVTPGNDEIPAVLLDLFPLQSGDTLDEEETEINEDGEPDDSNITWSSDASGSTSLRLLVPGLNDRNPRTWEFVGIAPAPLKVKVRITRIDPVPLDSVTAVP